jgi:glycosyltransferase involved in cell wall biosynthesis
MGDAAQALKGRGGNRIAFLFKSGREARLSGSSPTEFLYGLIQLRRAGYDAEIITDHEFNLDSPPGRFWRALSQLVYIAIGVPLWPLARLARRVARKRLNAYDHVVVTVNIFGICLGVMRRLKLIRPNIFFIAMGLIEPTTSTRVIRAYRWIFKNGVAIRTLSEIDANLLTEKLGFSVSHIPFGVDSLFWVPSETDAGVAADDYVLSIGNDSHRDYRTLLQAWKPDYPMLRVVTGQNIVSGAPNVDILRGDWHKQVLTDERIRTLIQGARFVILPIRNTVQPSGQSVCLQAMACGKAVVITDFPGLWNRELLRDGETCIIAGPPGDRSGLQRAVERLLTDAALVNVIGGNARIIVESDLNVDKMAEAIAADLDKLPNDKMSCH